MLVTGVSAAVAGCGSDLGDPVTEAGPRVSAMLQGEVLLEDPIIGTPMGLKVSGNKLWIADAIGDPAVHRVALPDGRLENSMGRQGDGPGEFQGSPELHVVPGAAYGEIWAWDYSLSRLTRLDSDGPRTNPVTLSIDIPEGVDRAWRLAWIAPDRVIGIHPSQEHRFSIVDTSTGELLATSPGDFLGDEEVPEGLRRQATMGGFLTCAWPGRGFALIYFWTGRIEIYDSNARLTGLAEVPSPTDPFDRSGLDGAFVHQMDPTQYQSCAVYEDRLYALYSGRSADDYVGIASAAGEYLHVFDSSGALIDVIQLSPAVHSITMDPAAPEPTLYAGSWEDARIYRFRLP